MSAAQRFGRFEVVEVLGRGATGTVYLARDRVIDRRVAIKEIRVLASPDEAEREEQRRRFEVEFRASGQLSHPNIVTLFDVGQAEDAYFIAMEYVPGRSLQDLLDEGAAPPGEQVLAWAEQLADGLDHAHRHGVVHRDVKPANVLITVDGRLKITDFGIAKLASSELTVTGTVLGTPAFMSPEQVRGQPLDGRSDQFSLAVILYRLLTGEQPFRGDHPTAILFQVVHEQPRRPAAQNPALASMVDRVLMKGLAKDPAERFDSCRALVDALRPALRGTGPGSPSRSEYEHQPTRRLGVPASSRRGPLVALAGIALVLLVAVAIWLGSARPPAGVASSPAAGPESPAPAVGQGTVVIHADYPLTVFTGGRQEGPGVRVEVSLRPGRHRLALQALEVFLSEEREVEVAAGQRLELTAPPAIDVELTAAPPDAQVEIESHPAGQVGATPRTIKIAAGKRQFLFAWPRSGKTRVLDVVVSEQQRQVHATPE